MDLLKNIVQETRQNTQKKYDKASSSGSQKYIRRVELEELAKSPRTPKNSSKKRARDPNDSTKGGEDKEEKSFLAMPADDVIRRLRALKQPIVFFGESDEARQKRLRQLEILEHEQETSSKGTRNVFQDMAEQVEQEILNAEALSGSTSTKDDFQAHQQAKKQKLHKYDKRRTRAEFDCVEDYILFFFKRLLREWEQDLQSGAQMKTSQGKFALATQKQTRQYIRPFFKLLKKREVDADILTSVEKIVKFADSREYTKANDEYLRMSIGNAPWPMGVTMVGIHERSGRAKIFSSQIAHILNDECQRKYIQSMKRLLTWCQQKYPYE